jgi:hypothetical protein
VERQNNQLYFLRATYPYFPGYRGRLWLDKSTFQPIRRERETFDMDPKSPISQVITVVDYADMPLGDGTHFVLPTNSDVITCSPEDGDECSHNVARFTNWHKFRGKARILSDK